MTSTGSKEGSDEDEQGGTVAELTSAPGTSKRNGNLKTPRLVSTTPMLRSSMQQSGPLSQFNPRMSMLPEGNEDAHEEDETNLVSNPLSGNQSQPRLVSTNPKFRDSMQGFGAAPQFAPKMSMLLESDEDMGEEGDHTSSSASLCSGNGSALRLVSTNPKFRSSMQEFEAAPQFAPRMSMLPEGDEEMSEEDEKTPMLNQFGMKAILTGWLFKRGPMFGYKWSQVWCVLESTGITLYSDDQFSKKKGDIFIGATTQAIPFKDSTIGESVKHLSEKPHGFVVDVDPSKGKSRKLYYFDAESEVVLRQWTEAIGQVARNLLALEMFPGEVGYGKFGGAKT